MYNLIIPIMNTKMSDKEKKDILEQLQLAKAEVLIAYGRVMCNSEQKELEKDILKDNISFFRLNGIKVSAWLFPTIGYGTDYSGDNDGKKLFTHLKDTDGNDIPGSYCPLDKNFVDEFCSIIKDIASLGVDKILLEDDFTLSGGKAKENTLCCWCDKHRQKYYDMIGEKISSEELKLYLFNKGQNKYRDVWLKLQGDTLREFANTINHSVHSDYPNVRIGLCANRSSYDMEGVILPELAKIIAGNTVPLIRLTGAPYWENRISYNIESVRLQANWCYNNGIELLTEGDTYPHSRYFVSANSLESYDMILRADGQTEGIMKYMLDYNSGVNYESGYLYQNLFNKDLYAETDKIFENKKSVGLNIIETMSQFKNRNFESKISLQRYFKGRMFPTVAQRMAVDNSIPCTYNGESCASIAFGENAKYISDENLNNGLIIDAVAAQILTKNGIDVGYHQVEQAQTPFSEYYIDEKRYSLADTENGVFYRFGLNREAIVLSEFIVGNKISFGLIQTEDIDNYERYPACYYYENKKHQKFLVYSFDSDSITNETKWHTGLFKNYFRQQQLIKGIEKIQGKALPATCLNNPYIYLLCKESNEYMVIGLWNLSDDNIIKPELNLNRLYQSASFYNCNGALNNNKIILESTITPYGFGIITLKK